MIKIRNGFKKILNHENVQWLIREAKRDLNNYLNKEKIDPVEDFLCLNIMLCLNEIKLHIMEK